MVSRQLQELVAGSLTLLKLSLSGFLLLLFSPSFSIAAQLNRIPWASLKLSCRSSQRQEHVFGCRWLLVSATVMVGLAGAKPRYGSEKLMGLRCSPKAGPYLASHWSLKDVCQGRFNIGGSRRSKCMIHEAFKVLLAQYSVRCDGTSIIFDLMIYLGIVMNHDQNTYSQNIRILNKC